MSRGARAATARHVAQFESAAAGRPLWMRGLNAIGKLAPRWPRLSAEQWWERARAGEPEAGEPTSEARSALQALVESIDADARLNLLGRLSARDDSVRMARTHLRIERSLRTRPEILGTGLLPPLFVVGWPRTGSTALHTLLAQDARNRTIPYWESFDPVPPESGPDRRIQKLERMLAQLERFAPDYHAIHPMAPERTEECVALFMNHFRSLQYDFQYRVPGYVGWLLEQDARVAYEAYRRSLQLIQHHRPGGERFVLKDPTHLVHLDTVVSMWPDAKIVFTHRDPVPAISSLCSLHAHTRAIFSDAVDPQEIGREVMAGHWPRALERARRMRGRLAPGQASDVRHLDLLREPLATVERVYAELGWPPLDDAARSAMQRFLDAEEAKPPSRHEHSVEGFGLTPGAIRERFRSYCLDFDLEAR